MSSRLRIAVALALAAGLLAGAACRLYNLERKLDPVNADFLSKVRYIISGPERRAFLELPDSEKPKFIDDFWRKRNPDPTSAENTFKIEYYKRIDQATKLFQGEGAPGWLTDRGRMLIIFGPPTERLTQPYRTAASRCQEVWYYEDYPVTFIDAYCTGTYRLATLDLGPLDAYNLTYMHGLNQRALDEAQKVFAEEANVTAVNLDADLKVQVRAPDRIEAVLGIEMPYERIWFKAEGTMMATTLEAALEIRDARKASVWESRSRREIRLPVDEVNRMTGKKYRWEIPILVEGAEKVGRLGQGQDVLVITLTNSTGNEILKKTLDFK